jgi:SAM-dependent methyltransferase
MSTETPAAGSPSAVTPDAILQLGFAFMASKTLLSAIGLGLFTELAKRPMTASEVTAALTLHPRSVRDFLDALVALGMLVREDDRYTNTPAGHIFLDRNKPSYIGGILEMANARLFGFWDSLPEALRTGQPQNEAKAGGNQFELIYAEPERLRGFLKAMTGVSMGSAMALAAKFPWDRYQTFVDVGCAEGCAPVAVARQHPHLTGSGFDLALVQPHFEAYVAANGLAERVRFQPGDFFNDELPAADVIVMGHVLHDWDLEMKKALLAKAYRALPSGGSLIVYEMIIDDERSHNAMGLLMSLNMLIETTGGFDFTASDCIGWMRETGFSEVRVEHLVGPDSMVVGVKP